MLYCRMVVRISSVCISAQICYRAGCFNLFYYKDTCICKKKTYHCYLFASVTFSVSCCMNNLIRNLFQSIYIPSWSNILSLISPTCAWVLNKYHTIHINVKRCINTCDLTKHRKGVGQNFQPRRVSLRLTKHHQRCNIEFYGHLLWTTLKLLFCVILSS